MQIRLASKDLTYDSIVDGYGLRMVIWMQGCIHNCPNCHNPHTHDLNGGVLRDIDDIVNEVVGYSFKTGVTISGGDPFCQKEALLELVRKLKSNNVNIWVYTGYKYEELNSDIDKKILSNIDVLVDGPFIEALKKDTLVFIGSSNQRIIDVPKTIENKRIIELNI